jgi:uncharacterized damage-inducible protein DinB
MTPADLLTDAFGRIREGAHRVLAGLDADALSHRPGPDANSIGWLLWHLLRIQDDHVAEVAGTEQAWTPQGFAGRFGLPYDDDATGYGQTSADVGGFAADPAELASYVDAVTEATLGYLKGVSAEDLARVVDDSWDPPVTLGVRLVSVVNDDLKHLGQAEYVKGLR